MKAAYYNRYGSPSVVEIREVEKPVPGKKDLLIKVYASTVNRTDCGFRSAEYFVVRFFAGLFRPKQKILGCEFSGEVVAIGEEVTLFSVGDKVFGFDDHKFGGHAEYLAINESKMLATIPQGLSYAEAAPILEGSHYALGNIRAAKVQPKQKVLVNGGTGAIGSAAIQLLKYFGAEVTAVTDTANIGLVKSLGADRVIDYNKEDFTQLNHSFHFVFDAVGKSSFGKCRKILKKKGVYISTELGKGSQNPFLALFTPLLGGKKVLFPIPTSSKQDALFIRELVAAGQFKPVIDSTHSYSLSDIVAAYEYVETGKKIGNVVIPIRC